jgi:O-antigen/teichoic acid export membrane protein
MSAAPENSTRLYLTNAASSVATRVLQLTVLVWVNQHLLKRIEPEEYSLFPVMISLMFFADIFKNIITGGLGRYIVEADSRGDQPGVTRIVSSIFPVVLAAAFLFAGAGAIAVWRIDKILNIEPAYLSEARLMLLLLVFSLCLNVVAAPFADGLYIRQRFVALNLIDLGSEAVRVSLLLCLLFGVSTKVVWLVVASTFANLVHLSLRVALTRRMLPAIRFRRESFSMRTARTLMRFGAWTSIQGLTSLVSSTAPTLLLNRFGTPVDVAAFYLGRLPEIQIRNVMCAASSPAQPAMTRIYARQGAAALNDLYYRGGRYHLWVTLFLVAPLLVFGKQMVDLYAGNRYAATPAVIVALLSAYPFLWASAMFFQVAHAIGKIGAYYICDIVVQAVTLGGMFYAVAYRGLGAPGAAMAMGLAGSVVHVFLIWPMGLRLVNGRWDRFVRQTLLPGVFPFASAFVACHAFATFFPLNSWLGIGLGCLVAFCIYATVVLVFCLDSVDRDLIGRLVLRIRGAFGRVAVLDRPRPA